MKKREYIVKKNIYGEDLRLPKMSLFQRFFGHLSTITKHKLYVASGCFKIGLYRHGIMHDLSKYSPQEFVTGVKNYVGDRSPNAVERELCGMSRAWLHHKGRNKHHFEYWIDFSSKAPGGVLGCRMPLRYVAEMVCDRRAACMAYHGSDYKPSDPWEYYAKTKDRVIMHPDTRAVLERALIIMRDEGEEASFAFIREILKKEKGSDYSAESLRLKHTPLN